MMRHIESGEQQALFQWAEYNSGKYPELKRLFHIPNGGKRNIREAARLKKEGVKAGVPDICLPVPRKSYHGMYIELKAAKGRTSDNQEEWIKFLNEQGYMVVVSHGWENASKSILTYLGVA